MRASAWAYAADIGAIADQHSDSGTRYGSNIVTDPQHWLLHADAQVTGGAEATIELPEGWSISAPWHELSRDGKSIHFQVPDTPLDWSASLVLGHFEGNAYRTAGRHACASRCWSRT
jgi:hypothetical protein